MHRDLQVGVTRPLVDDGPLFRRWIAIRETATLHNHTCLVDLANDAAKERLQTCASSPEYFFDATSNADLANAFNEITEKFYNKVSLVE